MEKLGAFQGCRWNARHSSKSLDMLRPRRRFFSSSSQRALAAFPRPDYTSRRFFFGRWRKDLATLEEAADLAPDDATKQAALYRAILADEPETIISRFEDPSNARNPDCVMLYLSALNETSQLDRAVDAYLAKPSHSADVPLPKDGSTAAQTSTTMPALNFGTKDKPLYVFTATSGNGWRRFFSLLNFVLIGGVIYVALSMSEGRIPGVSMKVHRLFDRESATATGKVVTFDDIQGCDEAKAELQEVVEFLKNPDKFNKLGARMPKGVLLMGPSGTGKTLLAKAVAGEANVPFIYASGAQFDELFVGIGSMRIRQMFESAKEQAPAIIFIDEIDAVGSRRNARDPQHARMSLNQLLVELDGFAESQGIVVIAATNFAETLDKALLRPGRFDRHVHVPLPDVRGRSQILEMYLRGVKLAGDVDMRTIARGTPGFSGADISKMVNQAKIIASVENSSHLAMRHLEVAKDEMLLGAERKSAVISEEDRRLTAFHESGHAIVALHTTYANPIHKATIIPRGTALGMVSQLPERDELSLSRAQLHARLDVAMGGRVAEHMIFGNDYVTTGASSDFAQATAIARAMVTQYGMSERIGMIAISDDDWHTLSAETKTAIDSEVTAILEAAKERATRILQSHRGELERLAKALLDYETLTKDEIGAVLGGKNIRDSPLDLLF